MYNTYAYHKKLFSIYLKVYTLDIVLSFLALRIFVKSNSVAHNTARAEI